MNIKNKLINLSPYLVVVTVVVVGAWTRNFFILGAALVGGGWGYWSAVKDRKRLEALLKESGDA